MEDTLKERFEAIINDLAIEHTGSKFPINQIYLKSMQAAYNLALSERWVDVKSNDEIPVGNWLFALEPDNITNGVQSGYKTVSDIIVIGSCFSWDMPKIISYQPLPTPPQTKD